MSTETKAILALENGLIFEGKSFGARGEKTGEIVFNTSMSGYEEILTDPSYCGQMVLMTAVQIGNTGINHEDHESRRIHAETLIAKDYCDLPSNWRSQESLSSFLKAQGIPAIYDIDTRYLTRILRTQGAQRAVLSTENFDHTSLVQKAKSVVSLQGRNLAREVSTQTIYEIEPMHAEPSPFRVVAVDLGIKKSILQKLAAYRCHITVVPWNTSAQDILKIEPDGIFFSNGPGDPAAVHETIETAQTLMGQKPIFGICLGHQLLAHALGGKTFKLKFGHHGGNHPVLHKNTGRVEITAQNHSFSVDAQSLKSASLELTHINLNDQTLEGFKDASKKLFAIQYHPEASPGPHDSFYLFEQFIDAMEANRAHV